MKWIILVLFLLPGAAFAQEADLELEAWGVYGVDGGVRVTAAVVNAGPDEVLDVDITAQFDPATAAASELPDGCTLSSIGVVCSFSEIDMPVLGVGEELVVEFLVTPNSDVGEVAFSVRSSTTDPDEGDNTDSLPLIPPTTVDVALDERGLQGPDQNTLVFSARNNGPDGATGVAVSGTVTINFDVPLDRSQAEASTNLSPNDDAICGRQVPDSDGTFDRWTFPVSCSIRDLSVDDEVEFRFDFEGNNAVFRLTATSDGLDTDLANNVTDGDFLNSPLEVIEASDEGCCHTVAAKNSATPALLTLALVAMIRRRTTIYRGRPGRT